MADYEYRWGPGHGGWIPFEELLQILNAWDSVGPEMGYPSVTISKRVRETDPID